MSARNDRPSEIQKNGPRKDRRPIAIGTPTRAASGVQGATCSRMMSVVGTISKDSSELGCCYGGSSEMQVLLNRPPRCGATFIPEPLITCTCSDYRWGWLVRIVESTWSAGYFATSSADAFAFSIDVTGANIPPVTPHKISGPVGHHQHSSSARSSEGRRVLSLRR